MPSRAELEATLKTLEAALEMKTYGRLNFFEPYDKQWDFIGNGLTHRERLLLAANQVGKSETGAYEMACHLTGKYPKNWTGRKFTHPIKAWAAGETATVTRNISQGKLCGEPGVDAFFGTGMIPKSCFKGEPTTARGTPDAYDTIFVAHFTEGVEDGISSLQFKSYEQGRKKFQAATLDVVWCDEEPPADIYSECLARITATGGMIYMTFTPLQGMSEVVIKYLNEPSPDRAVTQMTIEDAKHIPPEERAKIIAGYRAHEREARAHGVPMMGSGLIFPYTQESLMEPALPEVPPHWWKLWGIDFGINHPFAAVLMAWDKDADIIHLLYTIRVPDQLPLQHAAAMKRIAPLVPVAWPHDGNNRESDGEALSKHYKAQGLHMLPSHASWPDGSISTEAGIMEMQDRMTTQKLRVASHLVDWFEELRMYHRKDGLIVKLRDDLLSATRIAIMDKRHARQVPLGMGAKRKGQTQVADGVDFDMF